MSPPPQVKELKKGKRKISKSDPQREQSVASQFTVTHSHSLPQPQAHSPTVRALLAPYPCDRSRSLHSPFITIKKYKKTQAFSSSPSSSSSSSPNSLSDISLHFQNSLALSLCRFVFFPVENISFSDLFWKYLRPPTVGFSLYSLILEIWSWLYRSESLRPQKAESESNFHKCNVQRSLSFLVLFAGSDWQFVSIVLIASVFRYWCEVRSCA